MDHFRGESRLFAHVLLAGAVAAVAFLAVVPGKAWAGLLLDAELRLTYEDNVVGLLSDQPAAGAKTSAGPSGPMIAIAPPGRGMGPGPAGTSGGGSQSKGDFSTTLSAEAGGYGDVSDTASVFAKAFAGHTSYDTYTEFDTTYGGVGAGIAMSLLDDSLLPRIMIFGKVKRFGDSERDSTSYGGNVSLKEKLSASFWLREFAEYEKNTADSSFFSYTGRKVGGEAGYQITADDLVSAGYSYLDQKYVDPPGADMKTGTLYVSAEHTIVKRWSVGAEYDHQLSTTNDNGSATDNIYSAAIRYSY